VKKICLLSGKKINEDNDSYFWLYFGEKKFYVLVSEAEKYKDAVMRDLERIAERHPERGEEYEKVSKSELKILIERTVNNFIRRQFAISENN
jgi:hypothetical protein